MSRNKKNSLDDATHDSGLRNADHGTGSETHRLHRPGNEKAPLNPAPDTKPESTGPRTKTARKDPVQEVLDSNPNLSPPIIFKS